jgi:amphi-Trp domain-containing protein
VTHFKHDEQVSRQRAAEHLVDIAYALTAGGTLELRADGTDVKVPVPDRVVLKRESRSDGDRVEVEVVLTWSA